MYTNISVDMQNKFDNLNQEDFLKIAENAVDSVMMGKVSKEILVNLSSPDVMIFDPIIKPDHKHLPVEYQNGKKIRICIGLD